MKSLLTLVLSGLVPVFGLVSCTDSPETVHVGDSWSLPTPTLTYTRASKEFTVDIVNPHIKESITSDAALVFPQDKSEALRGAKISGESSCYFDSKRIDTYQTYDSPTRIRLSSLIPIEIFSAGKDPLNEEKWKDLVCDFRFSSENGSGSQHNFDVLGVKIDDFSAHQNLKIQHAGANFSPGVEAMGAKAVDSFSLLSPFQNSPADASTVSMICDDFQNHRLAVSTANFKSVLKELTLGEQRDLKNQKPDVSADTRVKTPVKRCRIVTSAVAQDNQTDFSFSPAFPVRFPTLPPTVTADLGTTDYNEASFVGSVFMTIRIFNPNQISQVLSLSDLSSGRSLQIQPVVLEASQLKVAMTINASVQTTIQSQTLTGTLNTSAILVNPQETVTITLRIFPERPCTAMNWRNDFNNYAGYAYGFAQSLELIYNDAEGGQQIHMERWPKAGSYDGLALGGWAPHPLWLQKHGGQRGAVIPAQPNENLCNPPASGDSAADRG